MLICQDCGEKIEYGRGWGGSVCTKCRAKRAHAARKRNAEISGKTMGNRGSDPLTNERRSW